VIKLATRNPNPKPSYQKGYLWPFACFKCRRSFKRAYKFGVATRTCPHCGGDAVQLGRKFKAPPADDAKQWTKVQRLVEAGFRFGDVWDREAAKRVSVPYPEKLTEVRDFLRRYGP